MTQDEVAGKIVAELWSLELITEKNEHIFYTYLAQAFAIGFDEGRRQKTKQKAVAQYDLSGKLVKVYVSQKVAANSVQTDVSSIRRALSGKTKSCKGFIWKWVDEKPPTSPPQTVGTYQPQSNPQK